MSGFRRDNEQGICPYVPKMKTLTSHIMGVGRIQDWRVAILDRRV
jgi:hypothetical protein